MAIDIEAILNEKLGKKARLVPKFVVRWFKNFIHQDFINEYLVRGRVGVDFCAGCLDYLGVKVEVEGLENLEKGSGHYTVVSNHPLGAIDGVTLGKVIGQKFDGNVGYLANSFLMYLKGLAPLCVPINKTGAQSKNLPAQINSLFQSDKQVIMFPAGLCSRKINGKVTDLPWSKTFITKSVQTKRDIVPLHFIAENSPRFYRIANICKKLHLKFNIAMLYLPDEMYKAQGGTFKLIIGEPIPYQTFDKSKTALEWAQWVREKAINL